jgi:hypothetical protein
VIASAGRGDIGARFTAAAPQIILTTMGDDASSEIPVPPAEFFRTLEVRRTRALVERDLATLDELHAPDYQLITPSGTVLSREAYLDAIKAGPFYAAWEIGAMSVRTSAHMAVVRYQALLRFPSGREVACWHTDSYERRSRRWQAVWSQATEIREVAGPDQAPADGRSLGSS